MAEGHPPALPTNVAASAAEAPSGGGGHSKRQRRPNVRLGDIGEQPAAIVPYEPAVRRAKQWKPSSEHHNPRLPKPPSRIRPNVPDDPRDAAAAAPVNEDERAGQLFSGDENLEPLAVAIRKARDSKARRSAGGATATATATATLGLHARLGWNPSRADEIGEGTAADLKSSAEEEAYNEFEDDLRAEDSESPLGRRSPVATGRVRVSDNKDVRLATNVQEDEVHMEIGGDNWDEKNGKCGLLEDGGVPSWLNSLGLGRYIPLFEIHEVDNEVLPMLTLEDLKDMGINAVGSRRKIYCAIQKLKKGYL